MSKRHQATRRKTYGRRQHEVREREQRHDGRDVIDDVLEAMGWDAEGSRGLGGLDLGRRNLRFITTD